MQIDQLKLIKEPETGTVTLSITDAPVEDDSLTGVWITITGVEFNTAEGGWQTYDGTIPDEPVNGTIAVTADFDLRKAVVDAGTPQSPHYILRPTIRLVVDGEAGWIHGPVTLGDVPVAAASVVAYAYADGTWSDGETAEPSDSTVSRFDSAVTSAVTCMDADPVECSYKLAFLAAGVYDIAVALFDGEGNYIQMWGVYDNAIVNEGRGTTLELNSDTLPATAE